MTGFEKDEDDPSLSSDAIGFPTTVVGETVTSSVVLYAPDPEGDWSGRRNWESTFDGEPTYEYDLAADGDFAVAKSSVTIDEHSSTQLTLSFTPTATGPRSGTLTVSRKGSAVLTATLSGEAVDSVGAYWSGGTSDIDFGTLSVGETLTGTATVSIPDSDDGDASLSISLSGTGFESSVTGSTTVSSDGTLCILLTFSPTSVQSYAGTLTVSWSRGSDSGTLTLALTGVGVDEDSVSGSSSSSGSSATDATSSTRAILYVPTWESLLALGEPYVLDSTTLSQKGFTASTTRHIFLRAEKSATVQADGLVWLQSNESSVYALSKKSSYYVSGSTLYLGAGGYVGLMAGYLDSPVDTSDSSADADPDTPGSIEAIQDAMVVNNLAWTTASLLSTIANTLHKKHDFIYLRKKQEKGWEGFKARTTFFAAKVTAFFSTAYFVYKYLNTGYEYAVDGGPSFFKALDVFAEAGILMGSPSVTTMMGMFGVSWRAPVVTLFGAVGVAIEGGATATLDSVFGQTAVSGGTSVTIRSPLETKIATRLDTLTMLGATMEVGGLVLDDRQQPTTEMTVSAYKEIELASTLGKVALTASPATMGKLTAKGGFNATLKSDLDTKIYAVAGFQIVCNAAGVTITGPSGPLVSLTSAAIVLGAAAGPIKLASGLTQIGASEITITPAGITTIAGSLDLL